MSIKPNDDLTKSVLKNSPPTPKPGGVYARLTPLSPPGLGVGGQGAGTSPAFSTLTKGPTFFDDLVHGLNEGIEWAQAQRDLPVVEIGPAPETRQSRPNGATKISRPGEAMERRHLVRDKKSGRFKAFDRQIVRTVKKQVYTGD